MSDTIYNLIKAQEKLAVKINNLYTKFASRPDARRTHGAVYGKLQRLEDYYK